LEIQVSLFAWRKERLWTEPVDFVLKSYQKILDNVYRKYATKKVENNSLKIILS
jgi:hypothetical protein